VSLFPAVISSSGTDVPAQDWIFLGQDISPEGLSEDYILTVASQQTNFSGMRVIADLIVTNAANFLIYIPNGSTLGTYEVERVTASGVSRTVVTNGTLDYDKLNFNGRHLITMDIFDDDITGYKSRLTLSAIHIGSPTSYLMTTWRGVIDTAVTTPQVTFFGVFDPGSMLRVYGIPQAVTQ
jgi:hypothetical protein